MVDIHSHILPGVDDGASDFDETKAMIKMAYEEGCEHLFLTPHAYRQNIREINKKYQQVKTYFEVKDFPKTAAGVRHVVLPSGYDWLFKALKLINPFGEFIFFEKGKRITANKVRSRMGYVCKKVGIPYRSPHKIRKTYVSILLDNHVDKRFVLDQVGHSCIEVSENFYHRNRKSIDSKREILDGIKEFG